jgi:amino acid permease
MSPQDTWVVIGFSFLPLAIGGGLLFLALRVARRWWWRAPALLAAVLVLWYWAVIVFAAAYPTIDQPSSGFRCTTADMTPIPCPPDILDEHDGQH